MEKIFKKSLALILSAALCLTALVGCLTVSATGGGTTTKPVYSVNAVEGAAGAEVEVVASFSEISNVCAHHVIFTFPAGLKVTAVKNAVGEDYVAYDNSGDRFDYKLDTTEDGVTKVQFLDFVNWAADNLSTSDMSIHFTVKIDDNAAANTEYAVAIAVQAADYEAVDLLDVILENGKVTVKAATTEPVLDNDITFFSRSSSAQDTLGIGYTLKKATVDSKYSRIEIISIATKYDSSRNKYVAQEVVIPLKATSSYYTGTYTGIAMYELDLPISTYVKCYDAEDKYVAYSETVTDTPVALLKEKYNASTNAKFKTMVTDMLNLGAAAQTYFASNAVGSDLANATLINDGWDQTYATPGDLTNLTILNDLKWEENSPLTSDDITFNTSLNHAATPTLGYLIKDLKNNLNADDLTLEVTYEAQYPKAFAGTRADTVTGNGFKKAGSYFTYAFSKMTLADSDRVITATLYYQGAKVLTYSSTMETAIQAKLTGAASSVALSVALGKFEASTRAYFASV